MEKLIPGPADFNPVLKEAARLMKDLGDHLQQVNTALYLQGFLTGVTVCAVILTALWAFSGRRQ